MRFCKKAPSIHRFLAYSMVAVLVTAITLVATTITTASPEKGSWGHGSGGVTELSETWYMAEGASADGYETWILLQNPGETEAAAELRFDTDRGSVGPVYIVIEAASRVSVNVGDYVESYNVATVVDSDRPIAAACTMYDSERRWAHGSAGSPETSRNWYFAEGAAVGSIYETWILLHNPSEGEAVADVTFQTGQGPVEPVSVKLGATMRLSINVGDHVTGFNVATMIESDRPIVAASTMYADSAPESPREKVLSVAFEQLGKPYASGAAGPDSFDCSGLTQYCYRVGAGIEIPHSSYAQRGCCAPVALEHLEPGDIVGFHGWGHVGIYIGNWQYIHSPQSGEVVEIAPLSERSDLCGAVRP